jgi:uncharacterized GH25 family protein
VIVIRDLNTRVLSLSEEYKMKTWIAAAALLLLGPVTAVQAHFVWVVAPKSPDEAKIQISFAEVAEPGEPELIGKIAHTESWVRTAGTDEPKALRTEMVKSDKSGALVGALATEAACSVEAKCDYGVVAKGEKPFLLQYYAKHIRATSSSELDKLARAPRLPLDIVPTLANDNISLAVLWNGKPVVNAEVVAGFGADEELTLKTNDKGLVDVPLQKGGSYAIRAWHVELDKQGERDGKAYDQVRHYATLTFAVPANAGEARAAADGSSVNFTVVKTSRPGVSTSSAAELLEHARQARSVWNDFPGFTADVTLFQNNEVHRGVISVNGDGDVSLKMPKSAQADWLRTYLESMVQHRMPDGPNQEDVRFVDDVDHPLGRKIALGDGEQGSEYRIKDNVITEVNRRAGPGRFTISVLDVVWTVDKKYLPAVFSITNWDADGLVRSNISSMDSWVRVGNFDLPLRSMQISTAKNSRDVRVIEFANHTLSKTTP